MKRSLILLGISILALLVVMVDQVYAGDPLDSLFVSPDPAYIHDGNRVDFNWYPRANSDRVSVAHSSSYEGGLNNFPGVEPYEWHSSYWLYDPWDVPDTDRHYWYGETGYTCPLLSDVLDLCNQVESVNTVAQLSTIIAPVGYRNSGARHKSRALRFGSIASVVVK